MIKAITLAKANGQPVSEGQRAGRPVTLYVRAMSDAGWRPRLRAAVEAGGKSWNAISRDAGLAPNYLYGVLEQDKEPTITRLIRVCDAIPVSVILVLHGHDVRPEDEAILKLLRDNPRARQGILAILSAEDTE